jgi:hypothetical protein
VGVGENGPLGSDQEVTPQRASSSPPVKVAGGNAPGSVLATSASSVTTAR